MTQEDLNKAVLAEMKATQELKAKPKKAKRQAKAKTNVEPEKDAE